MFASDFFAAGAFWKDRQPMCGAIASTGPSATPDGVLARFLSSGGFFGTVLHQFLSAETIQTSEEAILPKFLAVLFLRHGRTLLES